MTAPQRLFRKVRRMGRIDSSWRPLDFGVESILVRPPDLTVAGASE